MADSVKGLLSVAPDGKITPLSNQADGVPFRCTNDLDIAADGTIYFTDASYKFPLTELKADLFEHRPNGRLLAFDPKTGQTRTVLRDLHFANGVAISPDQSFVLVNETGTYAIKRVWLKGEKQGQAETFIDNLPGFPDGIMSNGRDMFWVAIVNRRDEKLDSLLRRPFLRKVVMRLPNFLQPEHQTLRIRARARHERQSSAQSSGPFARRFRANRECGRTQGQLVLRQHRRERHRPLSAHAFPVNRDIFGVRWQSTGRPRLRHPR